jgi:hypothetical protein
MPDYIRKLKPSLLFQHLSLKARRESNSKQGFLLHIIYHVQNNSFSVINHAEYN